MQTPDDDARRDAARRVRRGVRVLGLRTREYIAEASRASHLHDADIHAVGVLMEAERAGREVTAGDLARELALSPAAATALIDRMERAGHVVRRRSTHDGRRVLISLTTLANQTSDAMFDPLVRHYDTALADVDTADLVRLAGLLERLDTGTQAAIVDLERPGGATRLGD